MSVWKQIALCLLIVAAAVGGWYAYRTPEVMSLARETFAAVLPAERSAPASPPAGGEPPGREATSGGHPGPAGGQSGRSGRSGGFGGGGPPPVVAAPVEIDEGGETIVALGSAKAVRSVTIYPEVTGIVESVSFTPGGTVEEGDVLIELENEEQQVAVERARIAVEQARGALERAEQLAQSRNISNVALQEAATALQIAEIELRSAEIAASRRTVTAPFGGAVGLTDISAGDLVTQSTEIVTLDDLSSAIVAFEVPERFAGMVERAMPIAATARALPGKTFEGEVAAIDSRIDEATRTLRMEGKLANEGQLLKPGMAINVAIALEGEERLAAPTLSVQWDRAGSFVWLIDGQTARRVPVTIISRRSGAIVIEGDVQAGDQLVVEGVQRMRDGIDVSVVGGAPAPDVPAPAAEEPPAVSENEPARRARS